MTAEPSAPLVRIYQNTILEFWDTNGRKDLPWRRTRDPWKTLLVEVLLRKTTSTQVLGIYDSISPWTPLDLTQMSVDEVAEKLKPLGLSRVRSIQLRTIAQSVLNADPEVFHSDSFLRSLPGIGRYIANSVRCNAFHEPVPALDTNMIRVIQRVFSWKSNRQRLREDKHLWQFAETLVPKQRPMEYNWGVLDLGAMVCLIRKPRCTECPLNGICRFYTKQIENIEVSSDLREADSER